VASVLVMTKTWIHLSKNQEICNVEKQHTALTQVKEKKLTTHAFTLCQSNLNPYCLGRKAAFFFFSGHLNIRTCHYALLRLGQQAAFKSTTL
jgi:hypothetical protein